MKIVKALVLAARILLVAVFCCTVVGMALFIGSNSGEYVRWLPQNLLSYYLIYQMLSAFGGMFLFVAFFILFVLLLSALYTPLILCSKIKRKIFTISACLVLSALSLIDAVMITRIAGFSMPTVTDILVILLSVFITVTYSSDKIRRYLS